jgi:hypothetical protein
MTDDEQLFILTSSLTVLWTFYWLLTDRSVFIVL